VSLPRAANLHPTRTWPPGWTEAAFPDERLVGLAAPRRPAAVALEGGRVLPPGARAAARLAGGAPAPRPGPPGGGGWRVAPAGHGAGAGAGPGRPGRRRLGRLGQGRGALGRVDAPLDHRRGRAPAPGVAGSPRGGAATPPSGPWPGWWSGCAGPRCAWAF
jgi:hypothetical protein